MAGSARALGGIDAARERTQAVDRRVLEALGSAGTDRLAERAALVAVGSYGRCELAPYSDVDVLLLHAFKHRRRVEGTTRAILYPLWDAGFDLGYAVRTVGQCLRAAGEDVVIATTLFDARLVAGDKALLAELEEELARWRRKKGGALGNSLLASLAERHARFGDAGVDLEPHVKEGRGGLRDLHTLRWLDPTLRLDTELDFLLAVRDALHETAGRKQDRLGREHRDPVAARLGLNGTTEMSGDPRDELMRRLFSVCREVGAPLGWLQKQRLQPVKRFAPPQGFAVVDGRLSRPGPPPPESDPEAGFEAASAAPTIAPADDLLDWAGAGDARIPWTEETRDACLRVLREGEAASWELLDITGLWVRYFPELAPARAKTQHNPVHQLAVDAHCWETLHIVQRLGSDGGPLVAQVFNEIEDADTLALAALLHDMGKGVPGDHVRQGVVIARRTVQRMGFGAHVQELVAFLVQHHLVFSEFATSRDLDDEELVTQLASRIGTPERLRLLYLLTVADSRATGQAAWSEWKADLLAELYIKCAHVIEQGDLVGRDAQNRIERTRAAVIRSLAARGRTAEGEAEAWLAGFPRRYLLTQSSDAILAHLPAVEDIARGDAPVRLVRKDDQLAIVAPDRPGLLADITAVLAVAGVSVRKADIYTRTDGIGVDVMSVTGSHDRLLTRVKWDQVETDLGDAIAGFLDIDSRLAERAGRYDVAVVGEPDVRVDNAASDWYSVVDVESWDRVGLLHDIATVLADLNLTVHFAKVLTQAGQARDSFSVRDVSGEKIQDPAATAKRIRDRLSALQRNRNPG